MSRSLREGRWVAVFLVFGACVGWQSAAAEEKAPGKTETTIKRRVPTNEEELRKQLESTPEAGFDQQTAGELYTPIIKEMKATPPLKNLPADLGIATLQDKAARDNQPDMAFLPWLLGPDNELVKEDAEHL